MQHALLLVDDDVTFSTIIRNTLEHEGFKVFLAHHAHDAINLLRHHHHEIQVMLLDWSMPEITGIELLHRIKQEKEFEDVQVIMQTVMDEADHIQQGIEAGAFFYLVKPVKKELLVSTIRMAIQDYERKKELLRKLKESENSFKFLFDGTFRFQTLQEADYLAVRIANICPQPEEAMYITELFTNAIEHGNLGIGYEEKSELVEQGKLQDELIRRCLLPENQNKFVTVNVARNEHQISVTIEDMGDGFDFKRFMRFDEERILHNHGRGIAISSTFLKLEYIDSGNKVRVVFPIGEKMKLN